MVDADIAAIDHLVEVLASAGGAVGIGVDDIEKQGDKVLIKPAGIAVELLAPREGARRWRTGFFYEAAALGGRSSTSRRETIGTDPFAEVNAVAKRALVAAAEKLIDRAIDARS